MSKKPKRPRDPNQLAKLIVDAATGEAELPEEQPDGKNPDAVALGKLGGVKGGQARAAKLSKAERSEIATKAAAKRRHRAAESPTQPSASDAAGSSRAGGSGDVSHGPVPSEGRGGGASVTADELRRRRQAWARAYVDEIESADVTAREAKRHWLTAERLWARIDEIDALLASIGQPHRAEDGIPLRPPIEPAPGRKPRRRYRTPGATTDIVRLAYGTHGIEIDRLIAAVSETYKPQGTSRDTVNRLVGRLIREGYACREGTRVYLTDVCKRAWETSPLYPATRGP